MSEEILKAALDYTEKGWPVFPVGPNKQPLIKGGKKYCNASTDAKQIKEWFGENGEFPTAGIGMVTGSSSGIWVLDIDIKNGKKGHESIVALQEECGQEFDTRSVKTPSNGVHLYFKLNGTIIRNSVDVLGDGLDVRGDGGYVVAPPSLGYEWHEPKSNIITAPKSLVKKVVGAKKKFNNKISIIGAGNILQGERNDRIFREALAMRSRGNTKESTLSMLQALNEKNCSPPLDDIELQKIVESAFNYQSFPCTDTGNAERLYALHGNKVLYITEYKKFALFDGCRFVTDDANVRITQLAINSARNILNEGATVEDSETRDMLRKWSKTSESRAGLENATKIFSSFVAISQSNLDSDRELFNCKNGLIHLNTMEVRDCLPTDLITKQSNVIFNLHAECPTFINFLDRIFEGNTRLIEYMQRSIGYGLSGSTSEQQLGVWHGEGSNGKSTLADVLIHLYGNYACTTPADTLMVQKGNTVRNDIARLKGARNVFATESEEGHRLAESLIKQLTGGDTITCRYLYGEYFEYEPQFKITLYTNHKPIIYGTDNAIWRRIHLIPFHARITEKEKDKNLKYKLREELSGVLNFALEGYQAWQKQGLSPPQEVVSAVKDYRQENDLLGIWMSDCCEIGKGKLYKVKASKLFNSYKRWSEKNNEFTMRNRDFKPRMEERGFRHKREASGIYYVGIQLQEHEKKY